MLHPAIALFFSVVLYIREIVGSQEQDVAGCSRVLLPTASVGQLRNSEIKTIQEEGNTSSIFEFFFMVQVSLNYFEHFQTFWKSNIAGEMSNGN